jgi:hypothetical protein
MFRKVAFEEGSHPRSPRHCERGGVPDSMQDAFRPEGDDETVGEIRAEPLAILRNLAGHVYDDRGLVAQPNANCLASRGDDAPDVIEIRKLLRAEAFQEFRPEVGESELAFAALRIVQAGQVVHDNLEAAVRPLQLRHDFRLPVPVLEPLEHGSRHLAERGALEGRAVLMGGHHTVPLRGGLAARASQVDLPRNFKSCRSVACDGSDARVAHDADVIYRGVLGLGIEPQAAGDFQQDGGHG